MLIITRRVEEQVFIDQDHIKVMVLGVKGSQVRLGIEAPKSVSVHREEVYQRMQSEKRAPREVDDCPVCHMPSCRCEVACNE